MDKLRLCISFVFCAIFVSYPVTAFEKLAVLVVNSDYKYCRALPYTSNDGLAMQGFLDSFEGFEKGNNIKLLHNVSFAELRSWFGSSTSSTGHYLDQFVSDDTTELWIYYSGHGLSDGKKNYLMPVEVDPNRPFDAAYPIQILTTNAESLGVKNTYIIIDACYAGSNLTESGKVTIGLPKHFPTGGVAHVKDQTVLMQSCQGDEISWDYEEKMSLFTYCLLDNWWNRKGSKLTSKKLRQKTYDSMTSYRLQLRPPKPKQEPWFSEDEISLPVPDGKGALTAYLKKPSAQSIDSRRKQSVQPVGPGLKAYEPELGDEPDIPSMPSSGANPPKISLVSKPSSSVSRKEAKSGLTLSYTAEDDTGIGGYQYRIDNEPVKTTYRGQLVLDDLAPGKHTIQIQAMDTEGNKSEPVVYRFEVRGNERPSVRFSNPSSSGAKVTGKKLEVKLSGSDTDGRITTYRCAVGNVNNAKTSTTGEFSFEAADGRQTLYAQAEDDEGGLSDWEELWIEYYYQEYGGGSGGVYTLPGGVKLEMVYIEQGSFMMGSPSSEVGRYDSETQHRVTLTKGFELGKYEVTQEQWKAIMGGNPSHFSGCGSDCPVEKVSWNDCQDFIDKLNRHISSGGFRLPTEAEWEYACRAGTTSAFYTGRCLSIDEANYDGDYPQKGCSKGRDRGKTISVGSFSPNAWGLYDMHGNVWEWCQDWYANYPFSHVTNPLVNSGGSYRVVRGGGWSYYARFCRSAYRLNFSPVSRRRYIGFRLARTP